MARICLVTPSHPTSNPRLVKEADALQAAGHDVTVVAGRYFPPLDAFDAELLGKAPWQHRRVDYGSGLSVTLAKLNRRLLRYLFAKGASPTLRGAMRVHHIAIPALAREAADLRADLYIGHCLAGFAAAGLAAERTGARLGFDAEDFHPAETTAAETDPVEIASIRRIEALFLPRCHHFTAASPLIGAAYHACYGGILPVTVRNVFPLAEAPPRPVASKRTGGRAVLYWFSQTIGPGRGLEELIAVMGLLTVPCRLELRGLITPNYHDHLFQCARAAGLGEHIAILPLGPPAEMVRLAATADLGLSLERSLPRNRDLCLTNKIFTYLLAGVPVVLTPTSAQRALAAEIGAAAHIFDDVDPIAAARKLDALLRDPTAIGKARETAWELGQKRMNWDQEKKVFLASVTASLQ